MQLTHPGPGVPPPSYFEAALSDAGSFDGAYDDWCVDTDLNVTPGQQYSVTMTSSYDFPAASSLVHFPGNLDRVNWLLNQGLVGTEIDCDGFGGTDGTVTYGDLQRAIWALIEDENTDSGLGDWSPCRSGRLVELACGIDWTDGGGNGDVVGDVCPEGPNEGFTPDCGQYVGVILRPVDMSTGATTAQITMAVMTLSCVEPSCNGCVYTNNDSSACSDSDACTGAEACVSGVCTNPPDVTCGPPRRFRA